MTSLSTQQWIDRALTADHGVWNCGQIDAITARALNKLVKQGKLCKSRGCWQGISSPKTIWHKPDAAFSYLEGVQRAA